MTLGTDEKTDKEVSEQVEFEETTKGKALAKLKEMEKQSGITEDHKSDLEEIIIILEGNTMDIQVQRMYRFESDRPLKAFADIIIDDVLLIKGIKVLEGKQGLFVSMPQEQAKDKKWYDSVRCLTMETRDLVSQVVLKVYKEE